MAATHLVTVSDNTASSAAREAQGLSRPETGAQRVRDLQQQARALAREQAELLAADLAALAGRSEDVTEDGDAYPAGVRELAARIAEDLANHAKMLKAIIERTALPHSLS